MFSEETSRYVRWLRRLSFVPRWTCVPTVRKQTVMDHTGQVSAIVRVLLDYHEQGKDPEFRCSCYEYAIEHDIHEAVTGDAPSPSKKPKDYEALAKRNGQVYIVVKLADLLDSYMFALEEMNMGNKFHMDSVTMHILIEVKKCLGHFNPLKTADSMRIIHEFAKCVKNPLHPTLEASYEV